MLRGPLSNDDNFFREASLRKEIITVVWRYWITLFGGLDLVRGLSVNFQFFCYFYFFGTLEFGFEMEARAWRD